MYVYSWQVYPILFFSNILGLACVLEERARSPFF